MGFLIPSAKAQNLPKTEAVPVKATDAEVRKKKERTSRLARNRKSLGSTINTTGQGVQDPVNTQRKALLGD